MLALAAERALVAKLRHAIVSAQLPRFSGPPHKVRVQFLIRKTPAVESVLDDFDDFDDFDDLDDLDDL